jgi:hypothetical protein
MPFQVTESRLYLSLKVKKLNILREFSKKLIKWGHYGKVIPSARPKQSTSIKFAISLEARTQVH